MDINQVITKAEYDKVEDFDYDILSMYLTRIVKLCVEESLKTLPSVMTHLSSQAGYLRGLSDDFYKNNKDLIPHKKVMAQAIENIEGKNPGKKYSEVLELAAKESRDIISRLNQVPESKDVDLKQSDSHLGKL